MWTCFFKWSVSLSESSISSCLMTTDKVFICVILLFIFLFSGIMEEDSLSVDMATLSVDGEEVGGDRVSTGGG